MENNTVVVGTCACGGYGIVYNDETKARLGRCHDSLKFVDQSCEEVISILRNPYGVSKDKVRKARLAACDIIENLQAECKKEWGKTINAKHP